MKPTAPVLKGQKRPSSMALPALYYEEVVIIPFKAADLSQGRSYVLDRGRADFRELLFYALG